MDNCKIIKHIAVIGTSGSWNKEVNLVSWFGKSAKYDIRDWSEDHSSCGKGVSLTEEEFSNLLALSKSNPNENTEIEIPISHKEEVQDRKASFSNFNVEQKKDVAGERNSISVSKVGESSSVTEKVPTVSKEELEEEKCMTFFNLNKYLVNKYGRAYMEKWTSEEAAVYHSKDPNPTYNQSGETDYFDGDEDSSNPFIWEQSGKTAPIVPTAGSGAYVPRKNV